MNERRWKHDPRVTVYRGGKAKAICCCGWQSPKVDSDDVQALINEHRATYLRPMSRKHPGRNQ